MVKTSKKYNYFSAFMGSIIWGGWAYYVNSAENTIAGLKSGLAQGIASFIITLLVVFFVTKIFNKINNNTLQIILPATVVIIVMSVLLSTIHTFVGTPHILQTIIPSLSVAFIFAIVTALNLKKNAI